MSYKSTPIAFNTPLSYPSNIEVARKKPANNNAHVRDRMIADRQQQPSIAQQRRPDIRMLDMLSDEDILEYVKRRNLITTIREDMSCANVINHVCGCKLCSGVINPCQTIYIVIITVLCLTVMYLFNRLIDSGTI